MVGASIILSRALSPIDQSISAWRGFVSGREAFARLVALLRAGDQRTAPMRLPAPAGNLVVDGVVWLPPGVKEPVLKGVTFALSAGEILGVVGPSGAGKTSLAQLLVGTWRPQRGRIRLDGADLSQWAPEVLGPYIGYLPQDVDLFAGTVRENIARLGAGSDEAVIEAAQLAGAHDMIVELPQGYETQIGDNGVLLSGGQRQRIALARALFGEPKFLVLDEPNANLDTAAEHRLLQTLSGLKGRTTVVLITHRLNVLGLTDKIMLLRKGAIEAFGPRDQIISQMTRVVPMPSPPPRPAALEVPRK
jgi:PrtD family type I secretion system ABC transporter